MKPGRSTTHVIQFIIVFACAAVVGSRVTTAAGAAGECAPHDSTRAVAAADLSGGASLAQAIADEPTAPDQCQPLDIKPLSSLSVDTRPVDRPGQVELTADRPVDCAADALADAPTVFVGRHASAFGIGPACAGAQFCHRPLYFEEFCLERYGCARCCQPAVSAAHFFGSAILLPVHMCLQPPTCCVCTPPF